MTRMGPCWADIGDAHTIPAINAKAKERGVFKCRNPSVDVEKAKQLRDSGMGAPAIATKLGSGRASVYRALGG